MPHLNRNKNAAPGSNPLPERIRKVREDAGLTQTEAAKLLYSSPRTWQQWESGDRRMHPAMWELFLLKIKAGK